jgi:Protein of unknown function, DUF547
MRAYNNYSDNTKLFNHFYFVIFVGMNFTPKRILLLLGFVAIFIQQAEAQKNTLVSNDVWNSLLKKYVTPKGMVNYQGLRNDQSLLEEYIHSLPNISPDGLSRSGQMVYWINLYNAETVKLILDHYPVKSIRNIAGGKPWDEKIIQIGSENLSLNDIENKLRNFGDPRIHFAINCASKSCPPLRNEAFTSDKLDAQLDEQAKKYINNSNENEIAADQANLSAIFNWYKSDFDKSGGIILFINRFSSVKLHDDAKISFKEYDWNLNE